LLTKEEPMSRRLAYLCAALALLLAVAAGASRMGQDSTASAGPPIADVITGDLDVVSGRDP
jgi:hypothetical protein